MRRALLDRFHPAIRDWFVSELGAPSPPQVMGWPKIRERRNTLILAPTGSGKTLASFLVCIDELVKKLSEADGWAPVAGGRGGRARRRGPMVLYVSPLKALNYDIERNLRRPLRGIASAAGRLGLSLPAIDVGVRTGDTPDRERQRMVRRPPHILITTPESLHLMLTGSAREILRDVEYVIVDEIHSVCREKRGVFLSLVLERLTHNIGRDPVRIGLSATMRPLDLVAAYLGGMATHGDGPPAPRPVEIVNAGQRRELDVLVEWVAEARLRDDPGSIWDSVHDRLYELVCAHKSTIVFVNNRGRAERVASALNERAGREIAYPHHGSVAPGVRREIEEMLKRGKVPAVVATGTLELGIDMGDVDLVCQVESPLTVSRGLQRVGRAGHLMSAVSKGRILPKHEGDLLEAVVVAREMLDAQVEPTRIPSNCLDVLAQQIVAMVAGEDWDLSELYRVVRRSYCYRDLGFDTFRAVVEMVAGRYECPEWTDLRPRISLDPDRGRVQALPGARNVAVVQGGTIPDTGEYRVCPQGSSSAIGELEEEFVYESRPGDVFLLGTAAWRIRRIEADRVVVSPAGSGPGRMPFWKGEQIPRPAELGLRVGRFVRELCDRAREASTHEDVIRWLRAEYPVDDAGARSLYRYVYEQHVRGPGAPTDRRVVLEQFCDNQRKRQVVLLTLRGRRLHHTLRIAITGYLRREFGLEVNSAHTDDGLVLQLPDLTTVLPLDLLTRISPDEVLDLVLDELAASALFGLRFRHNAARALLLPGAKPGKRTPLWLQRLKAKDLLQIVKDYDGFPVIVETYRECMEEHLDVAGCQELLADIRAGRLEVVAVNAPFPSPFASGLIMNLTAAYVYDDDKPHGLSQQAAMGGDRRELAALLGIPELRRELDERALDRINGRLQRTGRGHQARTTTELYEVLRQLGDLSEDEMLERAATDGAAMVAALRAQGRLAPVAFATPSGEVTRWVAAEDAPRWRDWAGARDAGAAAGITRHQLRRRAFVTADELHQRYGLGLEDARTALDEAVKAGAAIRFGAPGSPELDRYADPRHADAAYRITLTMARSEADPASPEEFCRFLLRWQCVSPRTRRSGLEGLADVLVQLQGRPLPFSVWEAAVLPARVRDYSPSWLDELCSGGLVAWRGLPGPGPSDGRIAFYRRENLARWAPAGVDATEGDVPERVRGALRRLGPSFLADIAAEAGVSAHETLGALWDMMWHGEVAQDDFRAVRRGRPDEAEARQIGARLAVGGARGGFLGAAMPRWSLLPPGQLDAEAFTSDRTLAEAVGWLLLARNGVMARGLLEAEDVPLPWGALYDVYQRLEMQGKVARGYFVAGLEGAQFALPEAADALRGVQTESDREAEGPVLLNTCDPANPYGAGAPWAVTDASGAEVPCHRNRQNSLVVDQGRPALLIEWGAERVTALVPSDETSLRRLLLPVREALESPSAARSARRLRVVRFGDAPVLHSPIEPPLRDAGFQSDGQGLVYVGLPRPAKGSDAEGWPTPRPAPRGTVPKLPYPRPPGRRRGKGRRQGQGPP